MTEDIESVLKRIEADFYGVDQRKRFWAERRMLLRVFSRLGKWFRDRNRVLTSRAFVDFCSDRLTEIQQHGRFRRHSSGGSFPIYLQRCIWGYLEHHEDAILAAHQRTDALTQRVLAAVAAGRRPPSPDIADPLADMSSLLRPSRRPSKRQDERGEHRQQDLL